MNIEQIQLKLIGLHGMETGTEADQMRHIKALPFFSIVQSVEGGYTIRLDGGESCETGQGGFFLAPSQVTQEITHHVCRGTGRMRARWVFLDVMINERFGMDSLYDFPTVVPKESGQEMNRLFDLLFATSDLCEQMSVCYLIVKELLRFAREKETETDENMQNVLQFIRKNYSQEISVAMLAKVANMSEPSLYVKFRKSFHCPPISFLNSYRLSVASDLLKTERSVKDIALSVGIPDQMYFSKLFKRKYHASPSDYRKQCF